MKDNELFHTQKFKIRAGEIMPDKTMGFPHLVQLMQETSLSHIIKLGASKWDEKMSGFTWVLLRKKIEVFRYPKLGEEVTISTFPSGFQRVFAFRDYYMRDKDDNLIASASSTWALLDLESNKAITIPENLMNLDLSDQITPLARCHHRIKGGDNFSLVGKEIVNIYDLDWNGHVNNISYIGFILGQVSRNQEPRSLHIHFKQEAFLGNLIAVMDHGFKDKFQHFSVQNEDGNVLAMAEIQW